MGFQNTRTGVVPSGNVSGNLPPTRALPHPVISCSKKKNQKTEKTKSSGEQKQKILEQPTIANHFQAAQRSTNQHHADPQGATKNHKAPNIIKEHQSPPIIIMQEETGNGQQP